MMAQVLRVAANSELLVSGQAGLVLEDSNQHPSYIKWTYASLYKHFEDFDLGLPMYIEGDERTQQDDADFFELRMDGPFVTRVSKAVAFWDIEVNVLLQSHQGGDNLYRSQVGQGKLLAAFTNTICIYRLGKTELDDGARVGVYRLRRDLRESIDVNHFGLIRGDTRLQHTTVEGHYRWEVSLA